jgi:hypothetical protein
LGAIVSPPDTVAANAILQRNLLSGRSVTTLEGESVVTDASDLRNLNFSKPSALRIEDIGRPDRRRRSPVLTHWDIRDEWIASFKYSPRAEIMSL